MRSLCRSLIRTGSKEHVAEEEATGLRTLLALGPPDRTLETSKAATPSSAPPAERGRHAVGLAAALEADLHRTGQIRIATQEHVGRNADELGELLGPGWDVGP